MTVNKDVRDYIGGNEQMLCSIDTYNYQLDDLRYYLMNNMEITNVEHLQYREPGHTLTEGCFTLNTSDDFFVLLDKCPIGCVVDIYVTHVVPDDDYMNFLTSQKNLDGGDYFSRDNLDNDVLGYIKEFDSDDDNDVEVVHEALDDSDIFVAVSDDNDDDVVLTERQKGILVKYEGKEKVLVESTSSSCSSSDDHPSFLDEDDHDIHTSSEEELEHYVGDQQPTLEGNTYRRYKEPIDKNLIEFEVGMEFGTREEFKQAILEYSIAKRKDIRFVRNERVCVSAVCQSSVKCKWRIWLGLNTGEKKYRVGFYNPTHCCGKTFKNKRINAKWIAKTYFDRFVSNPNWKLSEIKKEIFSTYEVNVGLAMIRRARLTTLGEINSNLDEHYVKLWDYKYELEKRCPGSTFYLSYVLHVSTSKHYFKRFYICFNSLKKGFLDGCRKCIGLDGCFLKGVQKGILLTCVGRDANNQMFPIAWAVVQVENRENWEWFIKHLIDDLEMEVGLNWTLITDKQKGLVPAIACWLPYAEHRMCARHIYANWHKKHKGNELRDMFWKIAKSYTNDDMNKNFEQLKAIDEEAHNDLWDQEPSHWCRAYFKTDCKVANVDNNLAEAWNWSIIETRAKPIIYMLEAIRVEMMERVKNRRNWILKKKDKNTLCPRILKKINNIKDKVRDWYCRDNGGDEFEVVCSNKGQIVDLHKRTCTCRKWDLTGIPCVHVMAALYATGRQVQDYVDPCFRRDAFLKSYSHLMPPITGEAQWNKSTKPRLLPPPFKRMPGRPKKKRRREVDESKRPKYKLQLTKKIMTCSVCKQSGHNKSKCPENKEPKKKRTRVATVAEVDEVNSQAKKKKTKYNKTRNKKGKKSVSQPSTSNAPGIEVNTQSRQT